MNTCKRCGKENPAEIHTCSPKFTSYRQAYLIGFADGAESVSRWIKCSDRMPSDNEQYLVCDKYGNVKIRFFLPFDSSFADFDATHWMPLPTPPVS